MIPHCPWLPWTTQSSRVTFSSKIQKTLCSDAWHVRDGAESAAPAKGRKKILEELCLLEKNHVHGSLKARVIQKADGERKVQPI